MKAILEFVLPDESPEFETAQKGNDYKAVLYDLDTDILRPVVKQGQTDALVKDAKDWIHDNYPSYRVPTDEDLRIIIEYAYERIRDDLWGYMQDSKLDIV